MGHSLFAALADPVWALVCFFGGKETDPMVEAAFLFLPLPRAGSGGHGNNRLFDKAGKNSRDHQGRRDRKDLSCN